MFTDMVGYTALVQEDEAKARTLRDRCRGILRLYVNRHGGTILQFYGDGALCSFQSALEATRCAVEIQQALREAVAWIIRVLPSGCNRMMRTHRTEASQQLSGFETDDGSLS